MSKRSISILSSAFSLAASGLAFAADMGVKAPPAAPAPVYNWTGWYAGVNAGASFGNVKTDFNVAPATFSSSSVIGSSTFTTPAFAVSDREYPSGFIGGGQIGYNWQFSPVWVGGLEADFQGALEKDHNTLTGNFTAVRTIDIDGVITTASVSGSSVLDYQTKIDWFGTVRARLGYVWGNGTVMSYVTGGLAYGRVDIEGTSTPANVGGISTSMTQAFGHSHVNTGWTVGYGTEGVIDFWGARNWTWKIEGLYVDLGTLDVTTPGVSVTAANGPPLFGFSTLNAGPVSTHSHFTDGILRGGLNYKFY